MKELEALADTLIGKMQAYVDTAVKRARDEQAAESAQQVQALKAEVETLRRQVGEIPAGKDGTDGKDAVVDVPAIVDAVLKQIPAPRDGVDGKSVSPAEVEPLLVGLVQKQVDALPKPRDGRDGQSVSVDTVQLLVDAAVAKAVAALPTPKDGRDGVDGKDAAPVDVEALAVKAAALVPRPADGRDGRDAEPVSVDEVVAKLLPQIPKPRDGVDGLDGTNGVDGKSVELDDVVAKMLPLMPTPRDGTDGRDGKDGRDGIDGKSIDVEDVLPRLVERLDAKSATWHLEFERSAATTLQRAIDAMPRPKDGADGRDGKDGRDGADAFALDDFDAKMLDDGRTIELTLRAGERRVVKHLRTDLPVYCGVWARGAHAKGDAVTYGGSLWIARKDTEATPGNSADWQLAVKRGDKGRDAAPRDDDPPTP